MIVRSLSALCIAATVAACATSTAAPVANRPSDVTAAKSAITAALRNPASGQFKNARSYKVSTGERAVCVDVNAQNGFGGMTGFQPAAVFFGRVPGGITFLDELGAFACGQLASGVSSR